MVIAPAGLAAYFLTKPVLCSGLVNPYSKTAAFIVAVPEPQTAAYDRRITAFMSKHGLGVSKGSYPTSEPLGMRTSYTGHQVEGCDGHSYIWSDNSGNAHEYLVTFHRNSLFKDRTAGLRQDFLSEFRQRYHIRKYGDWRS
jgi:hypothetical protein